MEFLETVDSESLRLFAYSVLGASCLLAAVPAATPQRRILIAMAVTAFLLGLGMWFDVAGDLAEFGRRTAGSEGWYGDRRPVQAAVIIGIIFFTTSLAAAFWMVAKPRTASTHVPVLLISLLACYVLVRAISLHQLDAYLNRTLRTSDIRVGDAIELAWVLSLTVAVLVTNMRMSSAGAQGGTRTADLKK
jgi:hypothetical protein